MKFESIEELQEYLRENELVGLDSEYSFIYDDVIEKFEARGVDFNSWWVKTPSFWRCPSCRRSKIEMLRPNKHGYLRGHLHLHHDHMNECVKNEFDSISENMDEVLATKESARFIDRISFAVSSFDPELICADCNSADVKAKQVVSAPSQFSFSPKELSEIVLATPHEDHLIDSQKAHETWRKIEGTFDLRMRFVRGIAKVAATNRNWFQSAAQNNINTTTRLADYHLKLYGLDILNKMDPYQSLYSVRNYRKSNSSWRQKKYSLGNVPSKSEINHMVSTGTSDWSALEDSWICPCCKRSKVECVRKSNKGKWLFLKHNKIFRDPLNDFNSVILIVCSDCGTSATHISKEAKDMVGIDVGDFPSRIVSMNELQSIICSKPHTKHEFNDELANKLVEKICEHIEQGRIPDENVYSFINDQG